MQVVLPSGRMLPRWSCVALLYTLATLNGIHGEEKCEKRSRAVWYNARVSTRCVSQRYRARYFSYGWYFLSLIYKENICYRILFKGEDKREILRLISAHALSPLRNYPLCQGSVVIFIFRNNSKGWDTHDVAWMRKFINESDNKPYFPIHLHQIGFK